MRRYLFFATELYALAILRPLQAAIRERGCESAWYVLGPCADFLGADERCLATVAAVKEFAPDAIFVPGTRVPDFFPGIKVEVFHGFNVQKRSARKGHFRIRGMFDLYCTQGPDTTIPFRKLAERHGYFRVAETGWSKMDPLFAHTNGDAVPRRPRPVVLYSSTFNERLSSTGALFEEIRAQIARGPWDWILTLHPKSPGSVKERYRGLECERAVYVEGDDVAPLLMQADAMLSDTSSIVSEFLLLHKPVVTFRNRAPGPQLLDVGQPSEVMAALVRAISRPPELIEAIRGYAARIHPYRDGRSSHRVLDAVESFLREGRAGLRRKPLNLFRKLRSRRELGYYRIR